MTDRTRKLVSLGMLSAIAFAVMFLSKMVPIPLLSFGSLTLTYDPKDIVIAIGGFIYGPFSAFMMSTVVSILEMVTISSTGPIGCVMNILATCAFACTASLIYKHLQTLAGAVVGLVAGVLGMTGVMLLWNYFLTPLYMGIPRDAVAAMLLPLFLPFNLIKGGINAAITMLLYKPLVLALRRGNLVPVSTRREDAAATGAKSRGVQAGVVLVSLFVLATCVLLVLAMQGIL